MSRYKVNLLLVNKADLLTRQQRRIWARYFQREGLRAVFWSALVENERLEAEEKVRRQSHFNWKVLACLNLVTLFD